MSYISTTETVKTTDENGKEKTLTKENIYKTEYIDEPDYIKIYTRMWFEFNEMPRHWASLFFELATRMSYADKEDLEHSQIVATGGETKLAIMKKLNIKERQYQQGIKELTECGAIRKKSRGFYQINPQFAGKGEWLYNSKYKRGGIKDLKATFEFKEKKTTTTMMWVDDGKDTEFNRQMRKTYGLYGAHEGTVVTEETTTPEDGDITEEMIIFETNKRNREKD